VTPSGFSDSLMPLGRLMPRFHVRDAFSMKDKCAFVMAGFMIEGEIADHMLVRLPILANAMMTAEIDHIQHIRRPDGNVVCLVIKCPDPKAMTLLEALQIKDRTVDIIKADSPV
jgi:hypothetical protein